MPTPTPLEADHSAGGETKNGFIIAPVQQIRNQSRQEGKVTHDTQVAVALKQLLRQGAYWIVWIETRLLDGAFSQTALLNQDRSCLSRARLLAVPYIGYRKRQTAHVPRKRLRLGNTPCGKWTCVIRVCIFGIAMAY